MVQSLRSCTVSHWRKKFDSESLGTSILRSIARGQKRLGIVKRDRSIESFAKESGPMIDPGADGHVGLLAFEHRGGVGQRSAAVPAFDDPRIAAVGQRARSGNQCRRRACCCCARSIRFWLREAKSLSYSLALRSNSARPWRRRRREREIPGCGGRNRGATGSNRQNRILVLRLRQRIEIEHRLPSRLGKVLRYSAKVVRRQRPGGLAASCQKL